MPLPRPPVHPSPAMRAAACRPLPACPTANLSLTVLQCPPTLYPATLTRPSTCSSPSPPPQGPIQVSLPTHHAFLPHAPPPHPPHLPWSLSTAFPATLPNTPLACIPPCSNAFPMAPIDYPALRVPPLSAIQALWLGHATVLVQICDPTFITDPIFSQRCSPFQLAGPSRLQN